MNRPSLAPLTRRGDPGSRERSNGFRGSKSAAICSTSEYETGVHARRAALVEIRAASIDVHLPPFSVRHDMGTVGVARRNDAAALLEQW